MALRDREKKVDGILEYHATLVNLEILVIESSRPDKETHANEDEIKLAKLCKDSFDMAYSMHPDTALQTHFFGIQTIGTVLKVYQLVREFDNAFVWVPLMHHKFTWGKPALNEWLEAACAMIVLKVLLCKLITN